MLQALNLPKKVYFKTGCTPVALRELSEVYHCQRALLVTDPELYRAGIAAPVADLLRKQEIRVAEFFTVGKRVSFADLCGALPKLNEFQPDVIVGVGGNNAMSAAKTLLGFLDASGETDSACAPVWAMFDNEEVGSSSRMGAASSYLRDVLDRILEAVPHSAQASHRAMANSFMLSADNAHATHPNFPQKSDPCAPVRLGGGVVLKYNASQKYTTNAVSGAIFRAICRKAGVPVQVFTNRADEAGGSTLGNLQSHTLPIPMADIGCAQFAMHSAVETASVADAEAMTKAVAAFYRVHLRALGDGTYTLE